MAEDIAARVSSGQRVWAIDSIQSTILQYLPTKDIVTLLTVSKAHFRTAVQILYKTLKYDTYQQYIENCPSEDRLKIYQQAVRIIDTRDAKCITPVVYRPLIFAPFPAAVQMNCISIRGFFEPEFVLRDVETFPPVYTLKQNLWNSGPKARQTVKGSDHPKLPEDWKHQYSVYSVLGDLENYGHCWRSMEDVLNRFPPPAYICDAFHVDSDSSNVAFLQSLSSSAQDGCTSPKSLTISQARQGDLGLMAPLCSTLETLKLTQSEEILHSLTIHDFMREFSADHYPRLQRLYIDFDNLEKAAPYVPLVGAESVVRCARPGEGIRHIGIGLYYSSIISPERLDQESQIIHQLVRHLMPLIDPYALPFCSLQAGHEPAMNDSGRLLEDTLRSAFESEISHLAEIAIKQGSAIAEGIKDMVNGA